MAQHISSFDTLPDSAYLRQAHLVGVVDADGIALLPFSRATLWRKVRAGTFPAPVKLSERVTAWRVGDVRTWLRQFHETPKGPRRPRRTLPLD